VGMVRLTLAYHTSGPAVEYYLLNTLHIGNSLWYSLLIVYVLVSAVLNTSVAAENREG